MSTATTHVTLPTTGTWRIDTVHSYASFKVTHHMVATFRGGFYGLTGAFEDGALAGAVPVENIELRGVDAFKEHLLGPDWFEAVSHPELRFRSTELNVAADGSLRARGELTIRGVTKPVDITGFVRGPAKITRHDGSTSERLGIDLTTTLDRRDFGLEASGGAGWIVTLEVALEHVKS